MTLDFKKINKIVGVDDSFKMPAILMKKLFDKEKREEMFKEFLEHETNMSFDWFHIYFQEEYGHLLKETEEKGVSMILGLI
ncbi:hypothetical protein [Enterococcus sp. DIV0180]|uniref:hypothetical protein n=1 Tax=Enterococcus sp. DIV0180 TaxID=2774749 RepID=UPI003D2FE263